MLWRFSKSVLYSSRVMHPIPLLHDVQSNDPASDRVHCNCPTPLLCSVPPTTSDLHYSLMSHSGGMVMGEPRQQSATVLLCWTPHLLLVGSKQDASRTW